MEKILLTTGLACLIAGIIGGGLKAFGIEIPVLKTLPVQLSVLLFGGLLCSLAFNLYQNEDQEINPIQEQTPTIEPKPAKESKEQLKIGCSSWESNLKIFKKTNSHTLGSNGKSFKNRMRIKTIISSLDFKEEVELNRMKNKLITAIDNAPPHLDPFYDFEFTQEAQNISLQIELGMQVHLEACGS